MLYPLRTRWEKYLGCCSQEGRSSELRLRRGVGQAAHTLNNLRVECTGVYCAWVGNNCSYNWTVLVTNLASGIFITVNTHWPSRFILCCSVTFRDTQPTATADQSSYCYMCYSTHCSRDKHLARPGINKKKWKEIIFLPCLVLRQAKTKHDKIELVTTYSTYKNARKKRRKTTTTKLMYVNYTTGKQICTDLNIREVSNNNKWICN